MAQIRALETMRKKKQMTQKVLSAKSSVSQQTISAIESGQMKNPGIVTLRRLAMALECNVDDIFPEQEGVTT